MKALTVQQPWAWAIVHGGKDVENRTQAWSYRGPLAIHAGARISDRGVESPLVGEALKRLGHVVPPELDHPVLVKDYGGFWGAQIYTSAFIGVVDLVAVHHDSDHGRHPLDACSPWAEPDTWHLELANPRPLPVPIPCRGRLGLWTPPPVVLEQLQEVADA